MTLRTRLRAAAAKARNVVGYAALKARYLGQRPEDSLEWNLNKSLQGHPSNHNYRILKKTILPSFQLYERARGVAALYPETPESFLDVGCCRGYFVINAAQRPGCRVAAGVDVHEPFLSVSRRVCEHLGVRSARFSLATLDDVSADPESFGGPFHTVLLLGTYHYLFWGSKLCRRAYHNHEEILSRLATVCAGRVILSARLEIARLPGYLRREAAKHPRAKLYTTSGFLDAARKLFHVEPAGFLGKDPLFVLSRSEASAGDAPDRVR
ncbi:MAG: class I SAM-dependent methyltransferase [Planctomycetota bacterium]